MYMSLQHIHKEGKRSRVSTIAGLLQISSILSYSNLQEYYITSLLGQNIFLSQMNMFYMCCLSSTQMENPRDNLSVKAIIIDLLV